MFVFDTSFSLGKQFLDDDIGTLLTSPITKGSFSATSDTDAIKKRAWPPSPSIHDTIEEILKEISV